MHIDVEKMINLGLSLESLFVLHCLHNEGREYLLKYSKEVNKFQTKMFLDLIKEGWIKSTAVDNVFTFDNIELTEKYQSEYLNIKIVKGITFETAFEQLREHYPIKAGNSERRLQGDVARCKRLYQNVVVQHGMVNEELHSEILQCVDYEKRVRAKDRSSEYFQMLATWLQQKTWELYLNDVKNLILKNGSIGNSSNFGTNFDVI